jgi:hypothetical protein
MATRTPLRDYERSRLEPSHGLLDRVEEWAEEPGSHRRASLQRECRGTRWC